MVGRPAISGRRAACATARATSKTFKRLARVHAQVFFFFTFFFTVFPLATSRVERMRIEAKARKSKQKNKLNPFRNTGNRSLRQSSERSRSVYFFFLCFPASYFTRGRMRIEAKEKKREKKNKFNPFRNTGNRPLRRTCERSRLVFFSVCFPASFFTRGEDAN